MLTAAKVLVCALTLLGRSAESLPPITLLDVRPPGVSANAEGFLLRGPNRIVIVTSSQVFREAQRGDRTALKKIASVIAHEEWHALHGSDERDAYEWQMLTLLQLNVRPDSNLYVSVVRSMNAVMKAQQRRREPDVQVAAAMP